MRRAGAYEADSYPAKHPRTTMSEIKPLPYSTPENPVGPDDRYYLKVLVFWHGAFAALIAFAGVMVCLVVRQNDARSFGAGMVGGGILIAAAGLCLFRKRCAWFILCI